MQTYEHGEVIFVFKNAQWEFGVAAPWKRSELNAIAGRDLSRCSHLELLNALGRVGWRLVGERSSDPGYPLPGRHFLLLRASEDVPR